MRLYGSMRGIPFRGDAKPEHNKGPETGNVAQDGYRVVARAADTFRREMRRECAEPMSNNRVFQRDGEEEEY